MKIIISRKAQQNMHKVPKYIRVKVDQKIISLTQNPYPKDSVKLKGADGFRIRVGEYRIIYYVEKEIIFIVNIASRQEIYKSLHI